MVIGARSDILVAYFDKESIYNEIIVIDVPSFSAKAIIQVIRFCYTDELPSGLSVKDLFDLYDIGDTYKIEDILVAVETKIIESISLKNAIDIGNYAEDIGNTKIQTAANKFISKNLKAIKAINKNFENLSLKNSHMILELMSI